MELRWTEHTVPEECGCHSDNHSKPTEIESISGACNDGERGVEFGTGCAIQAQWDGHSKSTQYETVDSLSPVRRFGG
jgi:hypothetical protein